MPITAAQVETNGWVLRLTMAAAPTSPNTNFAAYAFDINTTPRLVLAVTNTGFVKSAGTAVAGSITRSLIGLKPLRQAVNPASPTVQILDEVDLGGGSIQVRVALSEMVYASSTGLSLSTLAGWRTGEAAQTALAVTNNSTLAAPLPIMRWALAPYEVATGSFRLSLIVGSHHPVGFDPVAGVKFTVTDGTNTKTVWATALSTDNSYGDNLRCHSVIIDPTTATALTAGLLRCDAEVYPYLGAMRSTDTLGTRSMAGLNTLGYSGNAEQCPFVIGYDPAGTRYSAIYAYIDPVNGSTTAATGTGASNTMIATTRAGAKAISPASRPRDVTTAMRAARNLLRTAPLDRSGTSYGATGYIDGLVCILAPGTHANGLGSTAQSSSGVAYEIPVVIEGDDTDSNPRANCVLQTRTAAAISIFNTRLRLRNLTVEQGEASLASPAYKFLDNVEVRAKTGFSASAASFLGGGIAADSWNWCVTRSKVWRSAWSLVYASAGAAPGLIRGGEFSRIASGLCIVRNRTIGQAEDGTTGTNACGFGQHSASAINKAKEDFVFAFNDCRYLGSGSQALFLYAVSAATGGTSKDMFRRHLIMNNVFEYTGNSQGALFGYGEGATVTMRELILEGNTTAGAGINLFYNNPNPTTLAEAGTLFSESFNCVLRNNAVDRNASKQDDYNDPQRASLRAGASPFGYAPHLIQCWAEHNGVGLEAHVDFSRSGSAGSFRRDGAGPRSIQFAAPTDPLWTSDQSYNANPANTGGGNYVPTAGSAVLNRIIRANSDVDLAGLARRPNGAAGAFEAPAAGPTLAAENARHLHRTAASAVGLALAMLPIGARHVQRASAAGIGLVLATVPAGGRHPHRATGTALGWSATLAGAGSLLRHSATPAGLGWTGGLVPASARLALGSSAPDVESADASLLIGPGDARLVLTSASARVLPDVGARDDQTQPVRSDARTRFITQTEREF